MRRDAVVEALNNLEYGVGDIEGIACAISEIAGDLLVTRSPRDTAISYLVHALVAAVKRTIEDVEAVHESVGIDAGRKPS